MNDRFFCFAKQDFCDRGVSECFECALEDGSGGITEGTLDEIIRSVFGRDCSLKRLQVLWTQRLSLGEEAAAKMQLVSHLTVEQLRALVEERAKK